MVTGASKGIGAACCRVLAANGAKVAVNARSQPGIDAVVDELSVGGADAIDFSGDCTRLDDLEALREATERALGPTDILLPYAGGFSSFTPLAETASTSGAR